MNKMLAAPVALLGALLLVAGCASTAPQYYSLAYAAPAMRPVAGAPIYIELAPVAVPERFARPQLVVRQAGAADGPKVDILEQHRWSSSFENELRDALASGIAGRLGALDATRTGRPRGQQAVRIGVQLLQFDALQGARVDAGFGWTVRRTDEALPYACRLSLSQPADGAGIDALARSAQQTTARLADAIAGSIADGRCPG